MSTRHRILLSAGGCCTMEFSRRTGKSKTSLWRWQEWLMAAGVPDLLRDKTRPEHSTARGGGRGAVSVDGCGGNWIDACVWVEPEGGGGPAQIQAGRPEAVIGSAG